MTLLLTLDDGSLHRKLADAEDVARAAVLADAPPDQVGEHVGVEPEDAVSLSHLFEAWVPGYRGWRWSVTVAVTDKDEPVTVSELSLRPGPDALVAPTWVPWERRVRAGDLGVGDLFPADKDDLRLVPAYLRSDDPAVEETAQEVGLGRVHVLSRHGRLDAAARWHTGEFGPRSDMARSAPGTCGTCGFFVPLAGSLRAAFGACANDIAPADGHVVDVEYGCGAHSEVQVEVTSSVPVAELVYDDSLIDYSPASLPEPATAPEPEPVADAAAAPESVVDSTAAPESASAPEPAADPATVATTEAAPNPTEPLTPAEPDAPSAPAATTEAVVPGEAPAVGNAAEAEVPAAGNAAEVPEVVPDVVPTVGNAAEQIVPGEAPAVDEVAEPSGGSEGLSGVVADRDVQQAAGTGEPVGTAGSAESVAHSATDVVPDSAPTADAATDSATEAATGSATEAATGSATEAATGSATEEATGSATEEAADSASAGVAGFATEGVADSTAGATPDSAPEAAADSGSNDAASSGSDSVAGAVQGFGFEGRGGADGEEVGGSGDGR
ncbi:hypothetical protein GCM10022222_43370 [Amycolatopsis ultiminotia]|uniref:DUF3027 domain-containing protein n=1 Tax=Amycolatopsis ultiminotia TaxID=543629 RepID=A0ABP6WUZ5_9PSEU